jgi:MFS family permease
MSTDAKTFSRAHDLEAIALVSSAHAASHFYHLVIPSLFPWLMPHFGLSYTQAGALMTAFFVTSAFGQAASGFLVDKIGPKRGLYLGLLLLASSAFVVGASTHYGMLFVGAILAGLGNCVFHPVDYSLMNMNISESRLGHAFAWHQITGNVGWALCPPFMVGLATLFGWRVAAMAAACVALLVLATVLWRRKTFAFDRFQKKGGANAEGKQSAIAFLKVPAVWLCFFFFFFTSGAFGVLQSYGPGIFDKAYGLNLAQASGALTAFLIAAGIGGLAGGFCAQYLKVGSDRIVAVAFGMAALMSIVLATQCLDGVWVPVLMALMGFGVGIAGPNRDLMIRKATVSKLGVGQIARIYGFVYCGMDCGQSLAPLVFGPLLDAGHFTMALIGVAVLQTLGIFTAVNVGNRERPKEK